tara:strand:- start:46 stop:603 length:558 start_codon:yes stop_codon:yes gene_type:complete
MSILYYSKQCVYCNDLILLLSKTKQKNNIHFICIDKREVSNNGRINIILDNNKKVLLHPNIKNVPSLYIFNNNNIIVGFKSILKHLKPIDDKINNKATNYNGEPMAFMINEMGNSLSDNYSYLNLTSEELSAKGNGGLRMMHSNVHINDNFKIETPEENYQPDKIGDVDLGKLQMQRNKEVSFNK